MHQIRQINTGKILAVKIIETSKMEDYESMDLLREVEILRNLVKIIFM